METEVAGANRCSILRSYDSRAGVAMLLATVEGEMRGVLLVGLLTVVEE